MREKNHATSQDTQKNHATSCDTKQSRNLSGQKKITQPLLTNKITQQLGTKTSW